MSDFTDCIACEKIPVNVKRTVTPSLAISRTNLYTLPLYMIRQRQTAVEYKCMMRKSLDKKDLFKSLDEMDSGVLQKAGIVGSDDPLARTAQGIASTVIPGDSSTIRNPLRATIGSLLMPGGRNVVPNPLARASAGMLSKPERGFRCPEGFQFGGQFTDKYFSTCGKKLFQLALSIGADLGSLRSLTSVNAIRPIRVSGREVTPSRPSDFPQRQISSVRQPEIDIPPVGSGSVASFRKSIERVVEEITSSSKSVARLVRRDGVVLEPLVSARVLRTVPDNRNMEGAAYVFFVKSPTFIGGEEMGMFSNSGIERLVYVLPNGSSLALRKKRNLSNGERRKLGRTIAVAATMPNSENPAARIEYIASEMDGPIAYEQKFPGLDAPNDMVTVTLPNGKGRKQMRRWHRDAFMLNDRSVVSSERTTQVENGGEIINDLAEATRSLTSGGQLGNIAPALRIPALDRTRLAQSRRMNDRTVEYALGRERLLAIIPRNEFEHIGAMVSSEVQSQLGMISPDVWFSGSGVRRPYIVSMPDGSQNAARTARVTGLELADPEDMARLMVADVLTDSLTRNPSLIYTLQGDGKTRTYASTLPTSAMSGMDRARMQKRVAIGPKQLASEIKSSIYGEYFTNLRTAQKKRVLALLQELLERAKMFSFDEFAKRMAIDGQMSEAERRHLESVKILYSSRVEALFGTIKSIREIVGG